MKNIFIVLNALIMLAIAQSPILAGQKYAFLVGISGYDEAAGTGCKARARLLMVDACRKDPESRICRNSNGPELASVTKPQVAEPPTGVAVTQCVASITRSQQAGSLLHKVG